MSLTSAQAHEITKNLTKEELKIIWEAAKERWNQIDRQATTAFCVGDKVYWESGKLGLSEMHGVIERVNSKTCTVRVSPTEVWKVGAGMLFHEPAKTD
jgi:hypothetical protein